MDTSQNQPESNRSTSHDSPTVSQNNVTFTDADMIEKGGSGDLGGGRVGGDLVPHSEEAVENEALVTDSVDDGDDIAAPQP